MHLIVPFAGTASPAGQHALKDLSLPNLERLLARLSPVHALGQDEFSLSLPHELALADARGWSLVDGALPWRRSWQASMACRSASTPGPCSRPCTCTPAPSR